MLNRELTGMETKALALKYVKGLSDTAIRRELQPELRILNVKPVLLQILLKEALRKFKTGAVSDFRRVLNFNLN